MATGPATEKGRVTRQRIVAAAAEVLAERGARGASMAEVRARAPASSSQIYHYFCDKADLLRAVAEAITDTLVEDHRRRLTGVNSWVGLAQWADGLVCLQERQDPTRQLLTLVVQLFDDERLHVVIARGFERWEGHIRDCLAAMVAAGVLRSDADLDWLAASTLASLQGGALLAGAQSDPRALRQALDGAVALIGTYRRNG